LTDSTIHITAPSELGQAIYRFVESGRFATPDEVLRAALDLLHDREKLITELRIGLDQLKQGDSVVYGPEDKQKLMDEVTSRHQS
jgi:Arc/MetJ-type ribon-helix-helix transcriptional regulator